jgi:hypothetical protein
MFLFKEIYWDKGSGVKNKDISFSELFKKTVLRCFQGELVTLCKNP